MFPRDDLQQLADDPGLHRAIFAGLGHGVVVISPDGYILDANDAHLRQVVRRRDELVGHFSPVYTHPDDLEAMFPLMLELMAGDRDEVRIGYRFIDGDGETQRCRITARRIVLDDDRFVVAVAYDPDHDAVDALEALDEIDAVSNSPLQLFFGPGHYAINDLDGTIARVPVDTCVLLGREAAEVVGRRWTDEMFSPVFPDGRAFTDDDDPTVAAAADGVSSIDIVGLRRPDGTRVWVSMQCALSPFRDGKGVVTSLTDVTAIARAHEDRSRLASIVDVAVDLVAAFDLDGRCRTLNTSAVQHLGRRADGLVLDAVLPPDRRAWFEVEVVGALRREGRWNGELELSLEGRRLPLAATVIAEYDDEHELFGWTLVGHDLTARKALEAELAHRATHDELTGIPNRALLAERMAAADRSGEDLVIAFVDLTGFKRINDTHGHHVGDVVLIEIARRLRAAVGADDFVARYGGDEFVVLSHPSRLDVVAELQRTVFAEPVTVAELELAVDASVGVAIRRPGEDAAAVLTRADEEMYDAKPAAPGPGPSARATVI